MHVHPAQPFAYGPVKNQFKPAILYIRHCLLVLLDTSEYLKLNEVNKNK